MRAASVVAAAPGGTPALAPGCRDQGAGGLVGPGGPRLVAYPAGFHGVGRAKSTRVATDRTLSLAGHGPG